MCLYDEKRFRFTFKRIPIFKVVYAPFKSGIYYSPFKSAKLSKVNTTDLLMRHSPRFYRTYLYYEFGKGFYHACLTEEKAYELNTHVLRLYGKETVQIIKGYIPAFTRYAIDIDGGSICARRMILNI